MSSLAEGARFVHVLFGAIGLAAFWIPVITRKGAVNHVRFGKIFVWSAYILLSAAAISLISRINGLVASGVGPADRPGLFASIVFLGYLTLTTFVSVRHGMVVLKYKGDPASFKSWLSTGLAWTAIAASVFIIFYALIVSPTSKILLFALSPIGLGIGSGILGYMRAKNVSKRAWMYEHLGAMIGSGIAFHTAFAVFGVTRLFDIGLNGWVAIIPWIAPAAIGVAAIFIWTRHYRQKFGEVA